MNNNSKVAQHTNQFVHSIDFNHMTIVDKAHNSQGLAFAERKHHGKQTYQHPRCLQITCVHAQLLFDMFIAGRVAHTELRTI